MSGVLLWVLLLHPVNTNKLNKRDMKNLTKDELVSAIANFMTKTSGDDTAILISDAIDMCLKGCKSQDINMYHFQLSSAISAIAMNNLHEDSLNYSKYRKGDKSSLKLDADN